ncbi:hypothetical protein [Lactiplantibacillus plantarum]|uniref:hypothetical protein n=1 Tax=Lactiplantibacillus plantarum TaxID=1590 RepID=UPI0004885DF8|nr:hypothetical protein [Lactiplantibacillus plantarum]ALG26340.1 hypothetical protein AN634_10065 [Lactiplantibacillus plantarum]AQX92454.1 hypothetical protein LC611_01380 [Lactiplantibacillus plantarum]ASI64442.1 hypothetical protein ALX04_012460 [Lactiplantibacillus plantarum subsp. plantarum]AWL15929.1 hypothetical protein DHT46_07190 [Lactiplantibacillus plantarum]AYA79987.1 hypothetical protein DWG19_06130 [Lactiplantibacillus plantarum]
MGLTILYGHPLQLRHDKGAVKMTTKSIRTPIQPWFTLVVAGSLLITLFSTALWWLASSAFCALLILNLQFIVFPTTADRYWLNRLSLGLVLALVVLANIKFLLISGLTWR